MKYILFLFDINKNHQQLQWFLWDLSLASPFSEWLLPPPDVFPDPLFPPEAPLPPPLAP